MIRHAPSIGLGLGLSLRGYGVGEASALDSDVLAFAAESGATDLTGLDNLVKYLKGEGLYNNFVIYPMKSAQNAGSGSTVYSLGGLTDNDVTLLNSPAWAASGIVYDGISQYGSISDFLAMETLTIFARNNISNTSPGTGTRSITSKFDGSTDRSFLFGYNYGIGLGTRLFRSSTGGAVGQEAYQNTTNTLQGSEITAVAQWDAGAGRALWHDKTAQSLTLFAGSDQTNMYDGGVPILINASDSTAVGAHNSTTTNSVSFATGSITTEQRESITDLINAL